MTESPIRNALLAQLLGALICFSLLYLFHQANPTFGLTLFIIACTQGLCAALVAFKFDAPRWWIGIHLGFMPLVEIALGLNIPTGWYLVAFISLLLVFWRTDRSRVPLYLSNHKTAAAVATLLPDTACQVVDIGCGDGRLLRHLARTRPDCRFVGIEHAPATWLWAKLASIRLTNLEIRYGNFWVHDLSPFAVVYAFLSPAPMAQLWAHATHQMKAGSLLISNSFSIPDVTPEQCIEVADARHTQLFCYNPAQSNP